MFEPIVANDTLELRHLRCLLAAMRFGKAIILDKCKQESKKEEDKRAQSHENWRRHDGRAEHQMKVVATGSKDGLQNCLCWDVTASRDCS